MTTEIKLSHEFYVADAMGTLWGFGSTPDQAAAEASQWLDSEVSADTLPRYAGTCPTSDKAMKKHMTDQGEMGTDEPVLMTAAEAGMFGVRDIG